MPSSPEALPLAYAVESHTGTGDAGTELRRATWTSVHCLERCENEARARRGAPLLPYSGEPARDRELWIVTDECEVQQVGYCDDTRAWTGRDEWRRTDGESGGWDASQIIGWADDYAVAEAAAQAAMPAFLAECEAFKATFAKASGQ